MDNNISKEYLKKLESLKIYDHDHLYKFEQAHIPLKDVIKFTVVPEYYYRQIRYPYDPNKLYLRIELPFTREYQRGIFSCSFVEAVDHNIIMPFLLFQDGRYIDWDHLYLVIDWSASYLVIDKPYSNSNNFKTILFPYDIVINDAATIYDINDRTLFMFNEEGYNINYSRFRPYLENKVIKDKRKISNMGYNSEWPQKIENPEKYRPGGKVIDTGKQTDIWLKVISKSYSGFPDGSSIEDDSIHNHPGDTYIMVSMKYSNELMAHFTGRYTNWYANLYIDGLDKKYRLGKANFVCFDRHGKLCDDDVIEVDHFNEFKMKEIGMYFDLFYYLFNNKSIDNSLLIRNKTIMDLAEKKDKESALLDIYEPFQMKFSRDISYEDNIENHLDKLYYHPNIIDDVNDNHTPIRSVFMKGSDLSADKDGNIYLLRDIINGEEVEDSYIMIFQNGELLSNYHEGKYINNYFVIPNKMILPNDKIELVYFTGVDNRRYDIKMPTDGIDLLSLSNDIDKDNIEIYSHDSPRGFKFNIQNKPSVYLEVEYTVSSNKIILNNEYYLGRPITLCSSLQFHHYSFCANSYGIRIRLPNEFDLCNKKMNYVVFINGRKQNDFHFTEMTDTRPFFEKAIYLHKTYQRGDIIDIFYLPYHQETFEPKIDMYGNIATEDENLHFNKTNSLLFINGKKIPYEEIIHLPMNGLRILRDYNSTKNIHLIQLTKPTFDKVYFSKLWESIDSLPNNYKDELLWLPSLGELPENKTINITRNMGISYDDDPENLSVGAVFASMFHKQEVHKSIMETGRFNNNLGFKVIEHAKNTIDDSEDDLCSDKLNITQVLYEIIKDYYVLPNMVKGIYSGSFYYDYDNAILDFDDKSLDNTNLTDIYIIRLLTAFRNDKIPNKNLLI